MDKKIEARFKPVIPLLKASRITVRYGSFYNNDTRKNAGRNEGKTAVSGVSFDLLPGQEEETLRPAMMKDGRVLRKGLAVRKTGE